MDAPVIRVFLVDDHEVVRLGVAELLDLESDLVVVGQASTATEAMKLVPLVRPDVAVLDVRLPDGDGVSLCRDLRSRVPELRCLMLTAFADEQALLDAIMAGAAGYVLKQVRGIDLVAAIRTVAAGQSLLDPRTTSRVLDRLRRNLAGVDDPLAMLSEQEHRVLELIGEGLTNREIAERMGLAEKTVKNYVSHLLAKLGVQRRTQVAILATELRQHHSQPAAPIRLDRVVHPSRTGRPGEPRPTRRAAVTITPQGHDSATAGSFSSVAIAPRRRTIGGQVRTSEGTPADADPR